MQRRLPPLLSLRAFEAAARQLSFTKAAEELFVTQAAISHQIKLLEDWIGQPLFRRMTRKVALTEAGLRLLPRTSEALDLMTQAVAEVAGFNDRLLTVTTSATFGARWLAPRIGRFTQAHPDLELRIHHSYNLVDFRRDGVDLGIRYGRGKWEGVTAEFLQSAELYPLAAPGLIGGDGALKEAKDVLAHVLLHADGYGDWMEWLKTNGLDPLLARRGPVFDDSNSVLQAALSGQGIALVSRPLASEELKAGRLVQAWKAGLADDAAYYLVYPPEAMKREKNRAFRDFVLAEMKR